MKFEITNRWTGSVMFSLETTSLKLCIEAAVKSGANLDGAYLRGANLGDDVPFENEPLQIIGIGYLVLVMDTHIKIGCKLYKHAEWENFSDKEISDMDIGALEWWKEWKGFILSLSLGHQQRIAAKKEKA